jgi:hypothetical protein
MMFLHEDVISSDEMYNLTDVLITLFTILIFFTILLILFFLQFSRDDVDLEWVLLSCEQLIIVSDWFNSWCWVLIEANRDRLLHRHDKIEHIKTFFISELLLSAFRVDILSYSCSNDQTLNFFYSFVVFFRDQRNYDHFDVLHFDLLIWVWYGFWSWGFDSDGFATYPTNEGPAPRILGSSINLIDWSVIMTDRAYNYDEEDITIKDQIVLLVDSWKIYVSLIYVSMYDEKQAKKSICEWDDSRSG